MIAPLVKKEILSNLLSYKFIVVFLMTILLTALSMGIMYRDFDARYADYMLIRPGAGDLIALTPPNPFSVLARGLDESIGRSYEINFHNIVVRSGQKSNNLIFRFFPTPDLLYTVQVVLSLAALLFGFDQVCREREQGTLKLLLSHSVSRGELLLSKWVGNFLTLVLPFLTVFLLALLLLQLDPRFSLSWEGWLRLGLMLFLFLLYVALFLSLGILVSTLAKRAATSLVILLFLWAALVFLLPNLTTLAARQMVEVPSVRGLSEKRQQIWTREILLGIREFDPKAGQQGAASSWRRHFDVVNHEQDAMEEEYRHRFGRLVSVAKSLNRLSPVASFVYGVNAVAGTGIEEESRYKEEVLRYKNRVYKGLMDKSMLGKEASFSAFHYRYRSLGETFREGLWFDLFWLALFTFLFVVASAVAFLRYDVR